MSITYYVGAMDAPEIVVVVQRMYRVLNIASVAIIAKTFHNYFSLSLFIPEAHLVPSQDLIWSSS